MAVKLITTEDCSWGEVPVSLFRPHSRGIEHPKGVKVASALGAMLDDLEAEEGKTLVHTLAVGSTERYGPNRNGDGFSREWNKKAHDRFVTNGHVYKHHKNKDPSKASGSIKLSAYNDEMDRIELVIELDNEKCANEIQKLASGKDVPGSMGCHVKYDVCSICGHKAPNPDHYCEHAKEAMTRILDGGQQVWVDNPDPGYFDWSLVGRPADRIAFSTGVKTASALFDPSFVFSSDLAKHAGLYLPDGFEGDERISQKRAALAKLSEMEKEIEATLTPVDDSITKTLVDGVLTPEQAATLKNAGIKSAMHSLHAAQVVLPVRDFVRLIGAGDHTTLEAKTAEVQAALPGIYSKELQTGSTELIDSDLFDGVDESLSKEASNIVEGLTFDYGMGENPLGERVIVSIIQSKPEAGRVQKTAQVDETAEGLACLYATYKLAALSHPANAGDNTLTRAAVLQNYFSHS